MTKIMNSPKLQMPLPFAYKFMEGVSFISVMVLIAIPIYYWNQLPEHVLINGGKTAGKGIELVVPIIGVLLYILMLIVKKIPHHFNYVVCITEENAYFQYTLAIKLMVWVNFLSMLMFIVECYSSIQSALSNNSNIGWWIVIGLLGVLTVVIVHFIRRMKNDGYKSITT